MTEDVSEDQIKWKIAKILISFAEQTDEHNFKAKYEALSKAVEEIYSLVIGQND